MTDVKTLLSCPCCREMMDWLWTVSYKEKSTERFECKSCELKLIVNHQFPDFEEQVKRMHTEYLMGK